MAEDSLRKEVLKVYGNRVRLRICGILEREGAILVARHQGIGSAGYLWAPPGGGLDFGETVELALQREFAEETGLEVAVGSFLFFNEVVGKEIHALELFFEVTEISGQLKLGHDPEMDAAHQMIDELRFITFDEAKQMPAETLHKLFNACHSLEEMRTIRHLPFSA